MITQSDDNQPFVKAKTTRLSSLNQSVVKMNLGQHSKAIANMIGKKAVRLYSNNSVVFRLSCILLIFAAIRPMVSPTLNNVRVVSTNQLYSWFHPFWNSNVVSWIRPGKTMNVRQKQYERAGRSPLVFMKWLPAFCMNEEQHGLSSISGMSIPVVYIAYSYSSLRYISERPAGVDIIGVASCASKWCRTESLL